MAAKFNIGCLFRILGVGGILFVSVMYIYAHTGFSDWRQLIYNKYSLVQYLPQNILKTFQDNIIDSQLHGHSMAKDKKSRNDTILLRNNQTNSKTNTSWTQKEKDVLVLIWAPMHDSFWKKLTEENVEHPLSCEETSVHTSPCKCRYTSDRSWLNDSDAVLGDVRMYKYWQYTPSNMPPHHKQGQYWILFNSESLYSNENTHTILTPGMFNLSATYLTQADIHLPYGVCENRTQHIDINQSLEGKKKGCLWYISDCSEQRSWRVKYGTELAKYILVEKRGLCSGHKRDKQTDKGIYSFGENYSPGSRDGELGDFKFYLSFENAYCKEYMTEKVYKVLASDGYTIPVVRGYGPYRQLLPEHSFINAADFSTPEHLAQYLHLVNSTPALFHDYFAWRKHTKCHSLYERQYEWPCRICSKVCELRAAGETRIMDNFDMFKAENICYYPKDVNGKQP